jgi:acyl carrier protein
MSTTETVYQICANILEREIPIGTEIDRENTPEWNSLKHMEIMFSLEESFDFQFTEAELVSLSSISAIIDRLESN